MNYDPGRDVYSPCGMRNLDLELVNTLRLGCIMYLMLLFYARDYTLETKKSKNNCKKRLMMLFLPFVSRCTKGNGVKEERKNLF